jgi:nitrilase
MTLIAAIQMASGTNVPANLNEVVKHIDQASAEGAELIVLPENFGLMPMSDEDKLQHVERDGEGPMQDALAQAAAKNKVWIVGGTIPIKSRESKRAWQTCFLYDARGQQVARYDKVHLFDVTIDESDERYSESSCTLPGSSLTVVDTPFGRLGLSICYDLRFPELYRAMLDQGMEIAAVPSAFTKTTGQAHWEVLVKARAIENSAYVIAAAQGGFHVNGRETYGHSMIVNPWGASVSEPMGSESGFTLANIDVERLRQLRATFPAIEHKVLETRLP